MIEIAIVDDEKILREEIERLIKSLRADCNVCGFEAGEPLLLAGRPFDIVFLDICLERENGIAIAGKIREANENAVLIFVTGVRDYVFQAFDVGAFHYLLKPLDPEKFTQVFLRAVGEVEKRKRAETELFMAKTRKRTYPIQKTDILYVESRGKKVEIHTAKERIELYASLNSLEAEFGPGFYRCHRGYLVNLAHIAEYEHDSILLSDGERIYMAREKYQEFVRAYMRYLKSGGISHG